MDVEKDDSEELEDGVEEERKVGEGGQSESTEWVCLEQKGTCDIPVYFHTQLIISAVIPLSG